MIYLCAGLYAEGPSDYHLLCPLIDRLLDDVGARLFPSECEVGPCVGMDAPAPTPPSRAQRIVAAAQEYGEGCTLFVLHTDGAGDPVRARNNNVAPGLEALRGQGDNRPVVACIPVQELEAWLLTDPLAFQVALGGGPAPSLPAQPEREPDPKETLRRILQEHNMRRQPERLFALFGEQIRLDSLRRLPAFRAFEGEIEDAVRKIREMNR